MQSSVVRDNPIFIKHLRSRLRGRELWPSMLVTIVFSALIAWLSAEASSPADHRSGNIFCGFLALQGTILFLMGTGQVFGSVFRAKEASVLDFHRISPLSALTLCVGFLFGAPVREYLLFALTLPFSLITVATGWVSFDGWLIATGALVLAAVLYHVFGLIVGLMADKGKAGFGAPAAVLFLYFLSAVPPVRYFTVIPACQLAMSWSYAISAPVALHGALGDFLLSLLHQGLFLVFLLLGAVRKMRQEDAFFWTKPLAVVFFFLLARLTVLDLQQSSADDAGSIVCLYVLLILGLGMLAGVTPPAADFVRGLRRAQKFGHAGVGVWTDSATNWLPLMAVAVIYVGTVMLTNFVPASRHSDIDTNNLPLAAMCGALIFVYFGSALQTALLRFKKQGRGYFLLFIFLMWVLPLLLGGVLGIARDNDLSVAVLSLSPLFGLGAIMLAKTAWTATLVVSVNALLALVLTWVRVRDEKAFRSHLA